MQGAVDRLKDLLKQLLGIGKAPAGDPSKAAITPVANDMRNKAAQAVRMANDPRYTPERDTPTEVSGRCSWVLLL